MTPTVAVVGASLAGLSAARALRAQSYDGRVVVVGDERHAPYDRPPLSKAFLAGTAPADDLALGVPDDAALELDWRLGTAAVALDPATRTVRLVDGGEVRADGVVLATGAGARRLPGALPGVVAVGDCAAPGRSPTAGRCGPSTGRTPWSSRPPRWPRCSAATSRSRRQSPASGPTSTAPAPSSPAAAARVTMSAWSRAAAPTAAPSPCTSATGGRSPCSGWTSPGCPAAGAASCGTAVPAGA